MHRQDPPCAPTATSLWLSASAIAACSLFAVAVWQLGDAEGGAASESSTASQPPPVTSRAQPSMPAGRYAPAQPQPWDADDVELSKPDVPPVDDVAEASVSDDDFADPDPSMGLDEVALDASDVPPASASDFVARDLPLPPFADAWVAAAWDDSPQRERLRAALQRTPAS